MEMPSSILVGELLKCHPCFDAGQLCKVQDFYEGGKRFAKNRQKYLTPRAADKEPEYLAARMNTAKYTPHFGDKTDDLVGCILRDPPRIELGGDRDDPRAQYWLDLNKNIDGAGHSIEWLMREVLVQMMLHERSYFTMDFPDVPAAPSGALSDDKQPHSIVGGKPGRARLAIAISHQSAEHVDDWSDDKDEPWIRTHVVDDARSRPFGPVDRERHTWTYITSTQIVAYVAEVKVENGKAAEFDKDAVANRVESEKPTHGLAYLPIEKVPTPEGFSLGTRLIETADLLWNTEGAQAFALFAGGLNKPVLATENSAERVRVDLTELGVFNVGVGGNFFWAAPPPQVFAAFEAAAAALQARLDAGIRALGDKALQTHMSGVAKGMDKSPKEVFLGLFRTPARQALQTIVDRIAELRKETDLQPRVAGMDQLGEQAAQMEVVVGQSLLGMGLGDTADILVKKQLITTNVEPTNEQWKEIEADLEAQTKAVQAANVPDLPLALQQLTYVYSALIAAGDVERAALVMTKMDQLLGSIGNGGQSVPAAAKSDANAAVKKTSAEAAIVNKKTGAPNGLGADQVKQKMTTAKSGV